MPAATITIILIRILVLRTRGAAATVLGMIVMLIARSRMMDTIVRLMGMAVIIMIGGDMLPWWAIIPPLH